MAKAEELDLDTSKKDAAAGGKSGRGKLIMMIVAAALLMSGTVVGALYFTGNMGGNDTKAASGKDKDKAGKQTVEKAPAALAPAIYLDLQPALVANFEEAAGASYLQIEMQLMARDKRALDIATQHMPVIRNNILLAMSAAKYEVVKTRAGKEQLQQAILDTVQQIVAANASSTPGADKHDSDSAGAPPKIEAVYFTSFIMQ